MKRFEFTTTFVWGALGETVEEAWQNVLNIFGEDGASLEGGYDSVVDCDLDTGKPTDIEGDENV